MRPIDTDALDLIAPSLGIGNPATATLPVDFDDGNLQQVLDVGRIKRQRAVRGELDFTWTVLASATDRDTLLRSTLFATTQPWAEELALLGLRSETTDVWLTDVMISVLESDKDNFDYVATGLLQGGPTVSGTVARTLFGAVTFVSSAQIPLQAAGQMECQILTGFTRQRRPFPILLEDAVGTALLRVGVSNVGGDTVFAFKYAFLFTLKGTPLWYEV